MKLDALLEDLLKKGVFGTVISFTWVAEFQKRGLPHVHILLILADEDKPRTPADFDTIVSAEVPGIEHPLARETVLRSMVHGPCGPENPNSPCMEGGKCSKGYPKDFQPETATNETGYPDYRRSASSPVKRPNGDNIDNRWIVPYKLFLCTKYDAHINVEICTSVTAVKYLFKYVYKGSDGATMSVSSEEKTDQEPKDEPKEYLDARYLSACECLWRLFAFPLHDHSPKIIRLPVHLENQQSVRFQESADLTSVLDSTQDRMLMGWFRLNERDASARQYTYPQIAKHYLWESKAKAWRLQKRPTTSITRRYFVHPRQGERFCLRLLLLRVCGANIFSDLKTPPGGGRPFATFHEAAIAHDLLNHEDEWTNCMDGAVETIMPAGLRDIFATILFHGTPVDPLGLWNRFAGHMSEDFLHRLCINLGCPKGCQDADHLEKARRRALGEINKLLKEMGSSLSDFEVLPQEFEEAMENIDVESVAQLAETAQANQMSMNSGQLAAFSTIISAIQNPGVNRLFFVDGPGGTGKSFVYNTLIAHVIGILGLKSVAVASSGIAALVLRDGQTAHSLFKIPIPVLPTSTCFFGNQSDVAKRLKQAAVIFWDEAPMMNRMVFEAVDRKLRDLMAAPYSLSGGKAVVFGGDFRQVAPVVLRASPAQIKLMCLNASDTVWPHVQTLRLTTNMRTQDEEFAQFLLRVGEGREPTVTFGEQNDYIRIPDRFLFQPKVVTADISPEKLLIQEVFQAIKRCNCYLISWLSVQFSPPAMLMLTPSTT